MSAHHEHHVTSSAALRDFVIGMSDGLTVPFALAAGLSGAIDSSALIVTAGVAEIVAGAIAMGLGGYMGAKTEQEHYDNERQRELREIDLLPKVEAKEVADILTDFGVPEAELPVVVNAICKHPEKWVDFMMRFELGLERPNPRRLFSSPLIIGSAYAVGGLVPLLPYMFQSSAAQAFPYSVVISLIALVAFGAFKGYFTGQNLWRSALQTSVIGSIAAAAAYGIAKCIQ
jgi:VIT1/CCC1 family predicted Fe2+/Mn2+ transporter